MSTHATPAAAITTAPALTDRAIRRIAGCAALVFAVLLLIQNVIRSGEPAFDADPAAVSQYFAVHRIAVVLPLALFPFGMASLLCLAGGLRTLVADRHDRFLVDVGTLAVVVIAALFGVVNIVEIALAGAAPQATSAAAVVAGLWAVHAAAFGLNLAAIAIALFTLSCFCVRHHLVPRWVRPLGMVGAGCLFLAAFGAVAIVEGSALLYLGFAGFLAWGVFLVLAGVGLLRNPRYGRSR